MATKARKTSGSEDTKELFWTLQPAAKEAIRAKLLECLQSEALLSVRHKVGDGVAEIARQYSDSGMDLAGSRIMLYFQGDR